MDDHQPYTIAEPFEPHNLNGSSGLYWEHYFAILSELVQMPLAAVLREQPVLIVRGKGSKERMVPLNAPARAALNAYLAHRAAFLPKTLKSSTDQYIDLSADLVGNGIDGLQIISGSSQSTNAAVLTVVFK